MKLIDRQVEKRIDSGFWRYLFTPLAVLVAAAISEAATYLWDWRPQAAIMYVTLFLSLTLGGLRSALVGAIIIMVYTYYHIDSYSPAGVLLIGVILPFTTAIVGGYLKNRDRRLTRQLERLKVITEINQHKIKFVDDLNGNIEASNRINEALVSIIAGEPYLTKGDIIKQLVIIQDWASDLAQRTVGWHKLWEEKKEVIERGE